MPRRAAKGSTLVPISTRVTESMPWSTMRRSEPIRVPLSTTMRICGLSGEGCAVRENRSRSVISEASDSSTSPSEW
ncbi:Uncharacterised protein [Mycobacteroides abscessus subsp. abscessus]|nr:Uncharacterised protein [Mycobacteroides abscessus subsp. abscessus]